MTMAVCSGCGRMAEKCESTVVGGLGTTFVCTMPAGHTGRHWVGAFSWPGPDRAGPDGLVNVAADVQRLRIEMRELSQRLNDNADLAATTEARVIGLAYAQQRHDARIEALEQAAAPVEDDDGPCCPVCLYDGLCECPAPVEDTQDGPPDRYAIEESGKPGYRTMVTDGGYPIAVCQKRADAERIAAALNAEPSAEVQAVVEAAKEHVAGVVGASLDRLGAAVDRLIAKEATT